MDELVDTFLDRDDHLEYRRAVFVSGREPSTTPEKVITKRFARQSALPANEDIHEIIYAIQNQQWMVTYHRDPHHIIASTR